ncbi:MAG: hypothetical protein ABIT37_13080 [Luteolibacter sp.]
MRFISSKLVVWFYMAQYHAGLKSFFLPFRDGHVTLREGMARLMAIGNPQSEVPWIVRIMENPAFDVPPLSMFHRRVNLEQHDCIHLLLGSGTTLMDEAFTIGFTMGSTKRMSRSAQELFGKVAGRLYPKAHRFPAAAVRVFHDAVHLAPASNYVPPDHVDFRKLLAPPPRELRSQLGVEENLLQAYYESEAARNPKFDACRRLVTPG